jgi:hypothetical protein
LHQLNIGVGLGLGVGVGVTVGNGVGVAVGLGVGVGVGVGVAATKYNLLTSCPTDGSSGAVFLRNTIGPDGSGFIAPTYTSFQQGTLVG